jgi:hypothetical protein
MQQVIRCKGRTLRQNYVREAARILTLRSLKRRERCRKKESKRSSKRAGAQECQ